MIGSSRHPAAGTTVWVLIGGLLMAVPDGIPRGTQEILLNLLIWIGLTQAWNIIGGIGGQLCLGHSVFVGAGGYTSAMLMIHAGSPWVVALGAGGLLCAVLGLIVSVPLLRLSGVYFTIGSAAVALIALAWMVTWSWTGQSTGLNIPLAAIPGTATMFRTIAGLAVMACVVTDIVLRSRFGLRLMAVRDDEGAAAALGVSPRRVKRQALVLSASLTGLVGSAIALNQVSINPANMFSLDWVVTVLVMAIVGGLGTTWGPVLGAFVIYYLIDRVLDSQPVIAALLGGMLIITVISLAPGGIAGLVRHGCTAAHRRPAAPAGPSAQPPTQARTHA